MKTEQIYWNSVDGWSCGDGQSAVSDAALCLVFGTPTTISDSQLYHFIRKRYPNARICGCSTAGEILDKHVYDDTLTVTACQFENTQIIVQSVQITESSKSRDVGRQLARKFYGLNLKHLLIFSDGLLVNGSQLIQGVSDGLPPEISVTGGLSGDGARFTRSLVRCDDVCSAGLVIGIGFEGERLKVGYGSMGGWDPFGPRRTITRSSGNVLYELDNQPALALYKRYLGAHAAELPASALLFPLNVWIEGKTEPLVRTVLSVNEAEGSMTFAGDLPTGSVVQLMCANMERLIEGASGAAEGSVHTIKGNNAQLALLISCVGRKLLLKQRVEEEVEAVADIVGDATITGFYSYGELSPIATTRTCELHNQTMTITTLTEI